MESKDSSRVVADELEIPKDILAEGTAGSGYDHQDMHRMGKKQELRRNFQFFAIVGFVSVLQATWESTLLASSFGLYNGGTAGVIWLTIVVWLGMLATIASMGEMAR